jgi:hypothetical protein
MNEYPESNMEGNNNIEYNMDPNQENVVKKRTEHYNIINFYFIV